MVTVRLFAALREIADAHVTEVDGMTVGEVADHLAERYGARFGSVAAVSSFVVNGLRADRATPVADGDEVAVLPPMSGGATGQQVRRRN